MRLLAGQQGGGLDCLVIKDESAVELLVSYAQGGLYCSAKELQLIIGQASEHRLNMVMWSAGMAGRMLSDGAIRGIKELSLDGDCIKVVLKALAQGACPGLLRLCLGRRNDPDRDGSAHALALALGSGHCSTLKLLEYLSWSVSLEPFAASVDIIQALCSGKCPALTKIDMGLQTFDHTHCLALAELLRSRVCPQLTALNVNLMKLDIEGSAAVMEALQGNYPGLTHLIVGAPETDSAGISALAVALSSGSFPRLQILSLSGGHCPDGMRRILNAIGEGQCLELRSLEFATNGMDESHGPLLGQILTRQACPHLEVLEISDNELGDEGLRHIFAALEEGACPNLKEVRAPLTGMGPSGAKALERALLSGYLDNLHLLNIQMNPIGDEAMERIMQVLQSSCRDLRELIVMDVMMGERAFVAFHAGLKGNAWGQLRSLFLGFPYRNHRLVEDLAATLSLKGVARWVETVRIDLLVEIESSRIQCMTHAFRQGACPALKALYLDAKVSVDDYQASNNWKCFKELEDSLAGRALVKVFRQAYEHYGYGSELDNSEEDSYGSGDDSDDDQDDDDDHDDDGGDEEK